MSLQIGCVCLGRATLRQGKGIELLKPLSRAEFSPPYFFDNRQGA